MTQLGTGPRHTPGPYGGAVQDAPNPDTDPAISFAFARRCKSPIIATIRSGLTVLCRTLLMPTVVLLILGAGYITRGVFLYLGVLSIASLSLRDIATVSSYGCLFSQFLLLFSGFLVDF